MKLMLLQLFFFRLNVSGLQVNGWLRQISLLVLNLFIVIMLQGELQMKVLVLLLIMFIIVFGLLLKLWYLVLLISLWVMILLVVLIFEVMLYCGLFRFLQDLILFFSFLCISRVWLIMMKGLEKFRCRLCFWVRVMFELIMLNLLVSSVGIMLLQLVEISFSLMFMDLVMVLSRLILKLMIWLCLLVILNGMQVGFMLICRVLCLIVFFIVLVVWIEVMFIRVQMFRINEVRYFFIF